MFDVMHFLHTLAKILLRHILRSALMDSICFTHVFVILVILLTFTVCRLKPLLKACSKLFSHFAVLIENGYITTM